MIDDHNLVINGMRVIRSPLLGGPRMTLSAAARKVVTPEFADEMDAWMLEFFGTKDSRAIVAQEMNTIFVSPEDYEKLRHVGGAS